MVFLFAKPYPLIYVFNHNPPSSWISRTFVQLHFSQSFLKKCKQLHFSKELEKVFCISDSSCIVCSPFTYKHAQFFFLLKKKNLHSFIFDVVVLLFISCLKFWTVFILLNLLRYLTLYPSSSDLTFHFSGCPATLPHPFRETLFWEGLVTVGSSYQIAYL